MENKPYLKDIKINIDDRGKIIQYYNEDLPTIPKRIYIINNFSTNIIRAFHKNFNEWKYFIVIKGSIKIICIDKNKEEKIKFILSADKPQILIIPPEWWNGWKTLEKNTILMGMADTTLETHKDERCPYNEFGKLIWQTENR